MMNFITSLVTSGASAPDAFRVAPNTRIYAVGDIHGRADCLAVLFSKITADKKNYAGRVEVVFIGDYIDRGPSSATAVQMVRRAQDLLGADAIIHLRGNHEQALLDFMNDPNACPQWLHWGGVEALQSYGVEKVHSRSPESLAAEINHIFTENGDWDFMHHTRLQYVSGDYLFVHAGVRPGVALKNQIESDLLFIRDDFIRHPHKLPYRVVFGHTILPHVLIEPDKIGIDTGAFESGILSCVVLEGESVRVVDTRS